MLDAIIWLWLAVFVIFFYVNIKEKSENFGMIAGIWFMLLGLAIAVDGLQTYGGVVETVSGSVTYINNTFVDIQLPFSTVSNVWGVPFLLVGFYIFWYNLPD